MSLLVLVLIAVIYFMIAVVFGLVEKVRVLEEANKAPEALAMAAK